MRPLFELSHGPLLKSGLGGPWPDIAPTRRPQVGDLNRCIFPLTKIGMTWKGAITRRPKVGDLNRSIFHLNKDWNGLHAEGHYSSLHAFVSFKLPIPTDKNHNITLLPRKSEKRCKRETSLKDFVGMKSKFQTLFLDL